MAEREHGRPAAPAISRVAALAGVLVAALLGLGVGLLLAGSDDGDEDAAGRAAPADPRPVSASYAPRRAARMVLGGGALGGTVVFRTGTLDTPARIVLDRDPPVEGPPPPVPADPKVRITSAADYFNVDARRRGAVETGGDWDPPLELVIDITRSAAGVPDRELIACFYSTAGAEHAWKPIPPIEPGAQLGPRARDGFYLTRSGTGREAHIRSRHLTIFSIFRERRPRS